MKRHDLLLSLANYVATKPVCWLRIRKTVVFYTEVETGIVLSSHNTIKGYYDFSTQVFFKFYDTHECSSASSIFVEEMQRIGVPIKYICGLYDTTYPIYMCEYDKWLRFPTHQKNKIVRNDFEVFLHNIKTK